MTDAPIRSRIFKGGDAKEGAWPKKKRSPKSNRGRSVWVKGIGWVPEEEFPRDAPPQKAPYVISDTIPEYTYPVTGEKIDSRSRLKHLDKAHNTVTTDKKIAPSSARSDGLVAKRRKDARQALDKSVAMIDAGMAPLSEETRAMCDAENERISGLMGFDAFNVAGRKENGRGKRYKRRRK